MAIGSIRSSLSQIRQFSRIERRAAQRRQPSVSSAEAINDDRTERAVVAMPQVVQAEPSFRRVRPDASFVAHLIAMADRAPQTRERNRASGFEAADAYRGVQSSIIVTPSPIHRRTV